MLSYFYWKFLNFFCLKYEAELNVGHVPAMKLFVRKGKTGKVSIANISSGSGYILGGCCYIFEKASEKKEHQIQF